MHRDLKPENIFLRSHEPLDLVLGDFGLVRLVEGSMHLSVGDGTPAYLPPEADKEEAEVTSAWDWWSVGMICAELAGGRHPFALADGTMTKPPQIRRHFLAQRPVDLSAVTDERDLLLCRGLLVADRRRRWGAEQVRAWLDGETPALPVAAAAAAPAGARTVLFAGAEHSSAASLAAAFQAHWDEALTQLFQERDAVLVAELTALLRQEDNSDALAALSEQLLPADVGVRFARLLVEMDPALTPRVGAVLATPAGLEAAALEIVQHPGERVALAGALGNLRRCAVLRSWRGLEGMARGPETEREWLALIDAYEEAARALATERPDPELTAAWLLLLALDPARRGGELRERVRQGAATAAGETEWWAALAARDDEPAALVAALLTQGAAEVQAREELEERRAEEEAERLRLAAEEERRREEEEEAKLERDAEARLESAVRAARSIDDVKAAVREFGRPMRNDYVTIDVIGVCAVIDQARRVGSSITGGPRGDSYHLSHVPQAHGIRAAVAKLGTQERAMRRAEEERRAGEARRAAEAEKQRAEAARRAAAERARALQDYAGVEHYDLAAESEVDQEEEDRRRRSDQARAAQQERARSAFRVVAAVVGVALFEILTVIWAGLPFGGPILFLIYAIVDILVVGELWL